MDRSRVLARESEASVASTEAAPETEGKRVRWELWATAAFVAAVATFIIGFWIGYNIGWDHGWDDNDIRHGRAID